MENKPYPRIKNAILLCLLLIGIQSAAGIILGLLLSAFGVEETSILNGIGLILTYLLTFGLVIFIGFRKTHKKFNEVFLFNKISPKLWLAVIVFMAGFIIILSEIDNLVFYFLPMPVFFQEYFGSMMTSNLILSVILMGILPGFLEEMMFRGLMLSGFKENYSSKKAILMTALLFGIIHLNPWQFVTAFIIGIVSAYLYLKTNSILPCVYIHLFNNLVYVFSLEFNETIQISGFNSVHVEQAFQPLWFDAIGVVLTGIGVLLFINWMESSAKAGGAAS
jgi:membrane protease YdiL (CAAX protease family)